jgi:hypothetical protein
VAELLVVVAQFHHVFVQSQHMLKIIQFFNGEGKEGLARDKPLH